MAHRRGLLLLLLLLLLCGLLATALASSRDYVEDLRQNFGERSNSDLNNQMAAFQRASLVYMAYASYFDRGSVSLPGFRKLFLASSGAAVRDSQRVIDYLNVRGGHQQFPLLDMKAACRAIKVPQSLRDQFPLNYTPRVCQTILKTDPSASLKKKKKPKKNSFSFPSLFSAVEPAAAPLPQSSPEVWQEGVSALTDALFLEHALNSQLLDLANGAAQRGDKHLRHMVEDTFLTQQTERIKKLADVIARLRLYSEQDYPLGEYVIDLEMSS